MGCQQSHKKSNKIQSLKIKVGSLQNIPKYKVVLLGDASVGKTSILNRLCTNRGNDELYSPTLGGKFFRKQLQTINKKKVALQLWDTAGQQKFRAMAPVYYRNAQVIVLVYDVLDENSFQSIKFWLSQLQCKMNVNKLLMYIVGNKIDSKGFSIDKKKKRIKSQYPQITFTQTSAKTGTGIKQLFQDIVQSVIKLPTS